MVSVGSPNSSPTKIEDSLFAVEYFHQSRGWSSGKTLVQLELQLEFQLQVQLQVQLELESKLDGSLPD